MQMIRTEPGGWRVLLGAETLLEGSPEKPFAVAIRRAKTYTADRGTVRTEVTEAERIALDELRQEADGTLGTKWVPEIAPPSPPETFAACPGRPLRIVFPRDGNAGPALVFSLDPATRTASFADDVLDATFSALNSADNIRIGKLPAFNADYAIRIAKYWDAKSGATIFDAEIGGVRTLICRRKGRFKNG